MDRCTDKGSGSLSMEIFIKAVSSMAKKKVRAYTHGKVVKNLKDSLQMAQELISFLQKTLTINNTIT
jgi:hypothetical protein